jgi:hypothetical protein
MRRFVLLFGLLAFALDCRRTPRRETHTDVSTLRRRLYLPAEVRGVRWVAVPDHESTDGCSCIPELPEPDQPYRLYASVDLDSGAWSSIEARWGKPTVTGEMTLPGDVARAMLPASLSTSTSSSTSHVKGWKLNEIAWSKLPNIQIVQAIRANDLLVIEFIQYRATTSSVATGDAG